MTADNAAVAIVRALWERFERRDWAAARALIADDAVMTWPCSGERFHGGDAAIAVNAAYPEGWSIHVLEVAPLADGRILSLARVEHPPVRFFATSLFRIEGGLISETVEYWATAEPPPAWRSAGHLPGYERLEATDG